MAVIDPRPTEIEVVLPDGRFARYRPITVEEYLSFQHAGGTSVALAVLVSKCVTLDGGAVTVEDILRMNLAAYQPVASMVWRQLEAALRSKEVA
jgi:hypothetical protein